MSEPSLLPEAAAVADEAVRAAIQAYGARLTEARRALLRNVVAERTRHFAMVLEDLKDPHNISAVIRTSEVFGLQDVHVINEVNPYRVTRSVLKGSYSGSTSTATPAAPAASTP
jgi:tRNA G18 (ribose-2'-O)-methylase SpoU